MRAVIAVIVLGLATQQVTCQGLAGMMNNPAMLSLLMSQQGGAGGASPLTSLMPLTMAGGGEMNDLLLMQALSQSNSQGGSSGGSGGQGGSGGMDPMMLMMLANGGTLGAGTPNDMMTMMMLSNMMNQNNNNNNNQPTPGQGGQGQSTPDQSGGFPGSIASMLGNTGSGISPAQQNQLWSFVTMRGYTQRIMDAVKSPIERVSMEKDGLIPNTEPTLMLAMQSTCPKPTGCKFAFCESTEIPFTPESFYVCRGCPRCRLDSSQQQMMNMMGQLSGAGGQNMQQMAQQMAMMRAMGGSGSATSSNPMMALAMMKQMQAAQQPQPGAMVGPVTSTVVIPAPAAGQMVSRGQWTPPAGFPTAVQPQAQPSAVPQRPQAAVVATSTNLATRPGPTGGTPQAPAASGAPPAAGAAVSPSNVPPPPPEFIAMMKKMGQQLKSRSQSPAGTPPAGGPTPSGSPATP